MISGGKGISSIEYDTIEYTLKWKESLDDTNILPIVCSMVLAEFRHNRIVQSPHENYFNVCRQHKEK